MHVDELGLPTVPEPKPEDPEDVSWALSTAEAMWARGDHTEGIKWVRRAAEAASEAEDDGRALELAKAAADLTGLIAKRTSRASIDIEEVVPMSDPAPPPVPPKKPAAPMASKPPTPKMQPTSVTKQVTTPSRPPAPLPSKTSAPPPAMGGASASKGKPLGTNTSKPPSMKPPAKKGRRSRENLEAEAKAAQAIVAAHPELPADTTETTAAIEVPFVKRIPEREIGNNDPTFVGHVNDIQAKEKQQSKSAAEWDADSTQNLTGDELPFPPQSTSTPDGDRKTAVVAVPHAAAASPDFKSTVQSLPKPSGFAPAAKGASSPASSPPLRKDAGGPGTNPPATVVGSMQSLVTGVSPSSRAPHPIDDPQIVTSQAVRVVVWRDATGVHVAPAGTVVSAITVDAVLVALEPNADLTAWLTQKGR